MAGGGGLSPALLPSHPLVSLFFLWAARASRMQNFLLFPSLPFFFPIVLPSPSSLPLFPSPPLTSLSHLITHLPLTLSTLPKGNCTKSLQVNEILIQSLSSMVIMCRHTKPHTSPMYFLFSPHQEKTIMFVTSILFFCGECEITKQFFLIFVQNYEKTKVIVMSG